MFIVLCLLPVRKATRAGYNSVVRHPHLKNSISTKDGKTIVNRYWKALHTTYTGGTKASALFTLTSICTLHIYLVRAHESCVNIININEIWIISLWVTSHSVHGNKSRFARFSWSKARTHKVYTRHSIVCDKLSASESEVLIIKWKQKETGKQMNRLVTESPALAPALLKRQQMSLPYMPDILHQDFLALWKDEICGLRDAATSTFPWPEGE